MDLFDFLATTDKGVSVKIISTRDIHDPAVQDAIHLVLARYHLLDFKLGTIKTARNNPEDFPEEDYANCYEITAVLPTSPVMGANGLRMEIAATSHVPFHLIKVFLDGEEDPSIEADEVPDLPPTIMTALGEHPNDVVYDVDAGELVGQSRIMQLMAEIEQRRVDGDMVTHREYSHPWVVSLVLEGIDGQARLPGLYECDITDGKLEVISTQPTRSVPNDVKVIQSAKGLTEARAEIARIETELEGKYANAIFLEASQVDALAAAQAIIDNPHTDPATRLATQQKMDQIIQAQDDADLEESERIKAIQTEIATDFTISGLGIQSYGNGGYDDLVSAYMVDFDPVTGGVSLTTGDDRTFKLGELAKVLVALETRYGSDVVVEITHGLGFKFSKK